MGYALLLISFSKPATEGALDASEILILLCGLVLAIGAAGEYIEEHSTLPRWMKWSRRPKMVFVWMVALSLVGEFIGDAGVFVFSGHLETINDGEYAALNKEAGIAREDAADANERAGKLEKEAATLRKQAEDETTARVEIEDRVAWRRLDSEQRSTLAKQLRRFSGQVFIISYNTADTEAGLFASDLLSALTFSQWVHPTVGGVAGATSSITSAVTPVETGVLLLAPTASKAALSLAGTLSKLGFDARVRDRPWDTPPPSRIWVQVEPRPPGPQGKAKLRAQKAKNRT